MRMKTEEIEIENLLLDKDNPRLPEELVEREQESLVNYIANEYNTIEVARSIAEHGFFESEVLIAIKSSKGKAIVVEGNRRLTALKILRDAELRARLDLTESEEWEALAEGGEIEEKAPVQIAKNRRDVAPIIGYRHIAGIEPWDPWAKARFIAKQLEDEGLSFEETARIVGEKEGDVRSVYRNYRIASDAQEKLKVSAKGVKSKFGFFNRAMNSAGLRNHIGAPPPSEVAQGKAVLKSAKKKEVAELFSWMFGDDKNDAVITDSRQISDLGQVVASPDALEVLRETRDLNDALWAAGGVKQRLLKRLGSAYGALEKAELDIEGYRDDADVHAELDRCAEALGRLRPTGEE
jgi:hypothetical protein